MTIRDATARAIDVNSIGRLILLIEELIINQIAHASGMFINGEVTNPKGVCILTETEFANIAHAFSHLSPVDTVDYLAMIAASVGIIPVGLKLQHKLLTSNNPSWKPDEAWQTPNGNAYRLYMVRSDMNLPRPSRFQSPGSLVAPGLLPFIGPVSCVPPLLHRLINT